MTDTIIGRIDLALVSLYLFWLFFAGLIYWLQRENMREGYPLETESGEVAGNQGVFTPPDPKTFKLPHGRGEVSVPNGKGDERPLALRLTSPSAGSPFEPTGDPLVDGVGPAAWAERRDVPELDGKGHPKIVPMRRAEEFKVSAGRDPRGLPVVAHDGEIVGHVSDLWIDEPEQLVRYLEIDLLGARPSAAAIAASATPNPTVSEADSVVDAGAPDPAAGEAQPTPPAPEPTGAFLLPMPLARIRSDRVKVHSLNSGHFANLPRTRSPNQVTLLEEERICAYYCGGKLYASSERLEAQI